MNLLKWLRPKPKPEPVPLIDSAQLQESIEAVLAPPPVIQKKPKGRIIKQTRRPEYDPRNGRRGGRIIKAMPRELQKIKQAQEKFEDDNEQPRVESLED